MKDLEYISVSVRQAILEKYLQEYSLPETELSVLEKKIFGYPVLRRQVDKAVREANQEVDLERYNQYTEAWYSDIIKKLPIPSELDNCKDISIEEFPERKGKTIREYIDTVEGYKQFRNKVDDILNEFDFEKVHRVMKMENWEWGSWEDEEGNEHYCEVPSVYALRVKALKYILECVELSNRSEVELSTGGFEIRCYVYDLNDIYDETGMLRNPNEPDDFEHSVCLSLSFTLEEKGKVF